MKTLLKNALDNGINVLYDRYLRDKSNTDLVIAQSLQEIASNPEQHISFPAEYAELLRGCIESKKLTLKYIKKPDSSIKKTPEVKRFFTLLEVLEKNLLPIEITTAKEIAAIADSYRQISAVYQESNWVGDVHTHFHNSSSFGEKGRILNTVVRIMRSQNCLELGTAYGMSALFICEAMKSISDGGKLTTIEGGEQQHKLAKKMLQERYSSEVECLLGFTDEVIPSILPSLGQLDFVFHDAGHKKENYIRDFNNLLPALKSGAIFLLDDIRWSSPLLYDKDTACYEGWLEITNHPQVLAAVEINKTLGAILMA